MTLLLGGTKENRRKRFRKRRFLKRTQWLVHVCSEAYTQCEPTEVHSFRTLDVGLGSDETPHHGTGTHREGCAVQGGQASDTAHLILANMYAQILEESDAQWEHRRIVLRAILGLP